MAKVTSPLFSFQARGALAKSIVFFPWKGINVVRQWVIPANPRSDAQMAVRNSLKDCVDAIHAAMLHATDPFATDDKDAYAKLAATFATPRTWWNAITKIWLDQFKGAKTSSVYRAGTVVPADGTLTVDLHSDELADSSITEGNFKYGTSPTLMLYTQAAVISNTPPAAGATIADLINGTRYYIQFQPTLPVDYIGAESGIYSGVPAAA